MVALPSASRRSDACRVRDNRHDVVVGRISRILPFVTINYPIRRSNAVARRRTIETIIVTPISRRCITYGFVVRNRLIGVMFERRPSIPEQPRRR